MGRRLIAQHGPSIEFDLYPPAHSFHRASKKKPTNQIKNRFKTFDYCRVIYGMNERLGGIFFCVTGIRRRGRHRLITTTTTFPSPSHPPMSWPLPFSTEKKVTGRGSCLDIKVGHWKKEKNSRANNPKGNKKIVEKVFRPPGQKGKNKIKWGGLCGRRLGVGRAQTGICWYTTTTKILASLPPGVLSTRLVCCPFSLSLI